jgi:hypothetical protein
MKNRFNPDPTQAVRWGDPTYDEMLACFIDYIQEVKPSAAINRGRAWLLKGEVERALRGPLP